MPKRKLNTKRLYKLTKIFVIFVSSVSLLLATRIGFYTSPLIECYTVCDETFKGKDDFMIEVRIECKNDCLDEDIRANKILLITTLIGFGLPITFFGGTWFFNYLFPKKKNE